MIVCKTCEFKGKKKGVPCGWNTIDKVMGFYVGEIRKGQVIESCNLT